MFRPSGSIVLPFLIKKASLALRMESRLEKIFSMGINIMSLAVWLGEDRKCSAALFFHLILILSIHCQLFLLISGYYTTCNIKITYQCKIIIVPEEGWFGQPKYSTHKKDPFTLCRLLLLFSSFYM